MESLQCSNCSSLQAALFCMCEAEAVLLCTNCFPLHFTKFPGRIHHPYPTQAYPMRSVPGYFERLEKRSTEVPKACQELKKNLVEIDKCVEELASRAAAIITAIQEYVRTETEKLQRFRAQLQRDIESSVSEVERTLYDDSPALSSKYSPMLRCCGSDLTQLSLFNYHISDCGEDLKAVIELTDTSGSTSRASSLPLIHGNVLQCLDLATDEISTATLSVSFSNSTVFCQLDSDVVLAIGGKPATTSVYQVALATATVTAEAQTLVPRRLPGVLKHGGFVYLFGGSDGAKQLTACEKFAVKEKAWTALPDMTYARGGFSPCVFGSDIYLPDVKRDHRTLEVFNIPREDFRTVNVTIPASLSSNSVSFVLEGELILITVDKQLGRWRIGSEDSFRVSKLPMKEVASALSNIPPVRRGREVLWVRWKDGALVKFNMDTESLVD